MITSDEQKLVRECLIQIASRCDGASTQDGCGFSRHDADFGQSLAFQNVWRGKQPFFAVKLANKYRRQLPETLSADVEEIYKRIFSVGAVEADNEESEIPKGFDLSELQWSEKKLIQTRNGERMLSEATIPQGSGFWDLWKNEGAKLKASGYSVSKRNDVWTVAHWTMPDGKETPESISKKSSLDLEEQEIKQAEALIPQIELSQEIVSKLLSFQVDGVKRLVAAMKTYGSAVDASETGVGKCYLSLATAKHLGLKPVIVTPKAVIPSWRKVLKHFEMEGFVSNYEQFKLAKTPYVKIKTVEVKEKLHQEFEWNMTDKHLLIMDECHRAGAQSSQNSKLLIAAKKQQVKILGLSATIANDPTGMKAIGYMLGLHNLKNFYPWCLGNGCENGRFGLQFVGGRKCMINLHRQIFPHKGNRIRISDLGDAFPETLIIADAFDMSDDGKIQQAYDLMFQELAELQAKEMSASERQSNQLVIQLRARQRAELLKIPTLAAMAKDAIAEGMSVAVFLNFNDSVDGLAKLLNTNCFVRGNQSESDRAKAIEDFQSDKERVIICNIKAGGVGISLHDLNGNHPRLALISPTFSSVDLKQALGRVHRAGGKSKSIQKICFASQSIEEKACDTVREKINRIEQLNDGDLAIGDLF